VDTDLREASIAVQTARLSKADELMTRRFRQTSRLNGKFEKSSDSDACARSAADCTNP
jgi:hypothetical protein